VRGWPIRAQLRVVARMSRTATPPAELLQILWQADSPAALARQLLTALGATRPDDAVVWSVQWPHGFECIPEPACRQLDLHALRAAVADQRTGAADDHQASLLCDDGEACIALLVGTARARFDALPEGVRQAWRRRMRELLQASAQALAETRAEQAERMQRALFAIADITGSDLDPEDVLRGLHRILLDMMPADEFEAVTYDLARQRVHWLHGGETAMPRSATALADDAAGVALASLADAPIARVLADARPVQVEGPPAWLGVPMLRDGRVQGALRVQTRRSAHRFDTADTALLAFVAEQLLSVLERRRQLDLLERRVEDRTRELEASNQRLRQEIAERQRGEREQAAMYRIATLASQAQDATAFFREVHDIVGGLLEARNFYVALLSTDGTLLSFPYVVDERTPRWPTRPPGRGLTEYVLRTGRTAIIDSQAVHALSKAGEIDPTLANVADDQWLGAPLLVGEQAVGVVAVQSYDPRVRFDADDAELLTFAANQLAASLQRHRDSSEVRRVQRQFEHRVEERTKALRAEILAREEQTERLRRQALFDPLTGLANRIVLGEHLDRAIANARKDGSRFGLLYLDIDHFKRINDQHGHLVGDEVLRQVGSRLGACVREPDLVARLSGDEFTILLEHLPEVGTAVEVAERIREEMRAPMRVSDHSLDVSLSIGVAVWGESLTSAEAMLQHADVALYRAKQEGRDRYVVAEPA
jgi:diguanylate cyclase (GGDEF)-like protein